MSKMDALRTLRVQAEALVCGTSEVRALASVALTALENLFSKADEMHKASCALVTAGSLVGDAHTEVSEAVQYWSSARNRIAECAVVVAQETAGIINRPGVTKAARNGATEQLLASWETEWLREAAVTALATTPEAMEFP